VQKTLKRQDGHTCIYCLRFLADEQFNREHVMPEHLGLFRENFVLHRAVCSDCNKDLGDRLKLWLGRDSFEALKRWRFGQKPISEFKKFRGRAVKLRLPPGTPWSGAILVLRGNDDTDELFVDLTPLIGIKRHGSEEFRFFTDDEFAKSSNEETRNSE
jgi:HNH endonuclease